MSKKEALTVQTLINQVLVDKLGIPSKNIVNDTTFKKYTGDRRADLLISNTSYEIESTNNDSFIQNLLISAEAKDYNSTIKSKDWADAFKQGQEKADKFGLPLFAITNLKETRFYNLKRSWSVENFSDAEIFLNNKPIREFQTLDILKLIRVQLGLDNELVNINTNLDSQSSVSEARFNQILWNLANTYRGLDFKNVTEKIDFTIGLIALKVIEEKLEEEGKKELSTEYWSNLYDDIEREDRFFSLLQGYIDRIKNNAELKEFQEVINTVKNRITKFGNHKKKIIEIYKTLEPQNPKLKLHNTGFDLFGAVYEMFGSKKEKSDFGEYFTRRHYTRVFSKLLLKDELVYNQHTQFTILDPACGTGGFLTEAFKILKYNWERNDTYSQEAESFLKESCIYGNDIKTENVARTKLNMFLVGDGHTNIENINTLVEREKSRARSDSQFKYILTNPPYGSGEEQADTSSINSKRLEVAFLSEIKHLLSVNGKACIIVPDGILENPSLSSFRENEILENFDIEAVISMPVFAFAPYTKEKTYALFLKKKPLKGAKQVNPIWVYIIDNDGFANSDKRFPTRLKMISDDPEKNGQWLHDELSGYTAGVILGSENNIKVDLEKESLLEQRWLRYDDTESQGTEWINEKGEKVKLRKAGFVKLEEVNKKNYFNLLPEYYLRPYEPEYITLEELEKELGNIRNGLKNIINSL